jgi:predicted DNA-binding transcriptional regulator YafY
LIGQEKEGEIKVFKLIRIQSEIKISSAESGFTKPEGFNLDSYLESDLKQSQRIANLKIRENKVNNLRSRGDVKGSTDSWDTLEIEFDDLNDFSQELLWYGDDLYVISPSDLRDEITKILKQVING